MVLGRMRFRLALLPRNVCGAMVSVSLVVAMLQALSNPVNRKFSIKNFVLPFCESHTCLDFNNFHEQKYIFVTLSSVNIEVMW